MKVDFYIIQDPRPLAFEKTLFDLCHSLYRSYRTILIVCQDMAQCQVLNDTLWTLKPSSFLPHEIIEPGQEIKTKSPILLSLPLPSLPITEVLINCSDHFFMQNDRYAQIIELVPGNETQKAKARIRYKQYQHPDRHLKLQCHEVKEVS